MKEKITYSSDLKCLFDLCNRANSNNLVAQFDLAKLYLHINRENTNKKAFLLLKNLQNKVIMPFKQMHSICWLGVMKKAVALQKNISSLQNGIG